MDFKKFISKESISEYPINKFNGKIIIIDREEDVNNAYLFLIKQKILGIDTESKPTFKKGVFSYVSLIQIATENQVFLFRINKVGFHQKIIEILSNKLIVKVGIAIDDDIKELNKLKRFTANNVIDLNKKAEKLGFKSIGAVKLSILILGFRISKKVRLSNWENDPLTKEQLNYAATDAWICYLIYKKIMNES
tara:strand:- start:617 stop:1195 length:579 start_codon:yes stop_codon:yes gene_type:complete